MRGKLSTLKLEMDILKPTSRVGLTTYSQRCQPEFISLQVQSKPRVILFDRRSV